MPRSSSTTPRSTSASSTPSCAGSAGRRSSSTACRVTDSLSMARDSFPGKSNSLDALCKRFEVNNATRELHGALLDAGLLAEVYIRMTRGQDSLVIDAGEALAADLASRPIDFSALALIVIGADEDDSRRTRRCSPRSTRRAADAPSGARCAAVLANPAAVRHGTMNASPQAARRIPHRAVSSGVEHVLHTDGVAGSKPAPPTNEIRHLQHLGPSEDCGCLVNGVAGRAPGALRFERVGGLRSAKPSCCLASRLSQSGDERDFASVGFQAGLPPTPEGSPPCASDQAKWGRCQL